MTDSTLAVVKVPHRGSCIVVVHATTILRASGFMGYHEAEALLNASSVGQLFTNANFIGDVLATEQEGKWKLTT